MFRRGAETGGRLSQHADIPVSCVSPDAVGCSCRGVSKHCGVLGVIASQQWLSLSSWCEEDVVEGGCCRGVRGTGSGVSVESVVVEMVVVGTVLLLGVSVDGEAALGKMGVPILRSSLLGGGKGPPSQTGS